MRILYIHLVFDWKLHTRVVIIQRYSKWVSSQQNRGNATCYYRALSYSHYAIKVLIIIITDTAWQDYIKLVWILSNDFSTIYLERTL